MHFRNTPWALLLLAPIVVFAFWPSYFGDLAHASFAFHAHGLTASAWLALLGLQSVTAQRRDRRLHRLAGRAVFALTPLFAGAAVLVMHSMAIKFAKGSQPFYAVLGARLGLHDLISTTVLVGMVCAALVSRRKIPLHAGFLLSTALLVLPPVIARLPIPRFFHSGEIIAVALAALVIWRAPQARLPFLILIGVQVLQVLVFETLGASDRWATLFSAFSRQPVAPYAAAAMAATAIVLVLAWIRGARSRSSTRAADAPSQQAPA